MPSNRRKRERVVFDRGLDTEIMALDGTWRSNCKAVDISQTGAKLIVDAPLKRPTANEFLLLLTKDGGVQRRCELAWIEGETIGARFVSHKTGSKNKND